VREESHLDEMRDAIRGDFERLAARRGEQDLLRVGEPETPPPELTEPPEQADEPDEQPDEPDEPVTQRRSWLGRLFST